MKYSQSKLLSKDLQTSFNGGYLFLQQIYHQLGLHDICKKISKNYKLTFNLDSILSRLIYGRILFPSSKLNTYQESKMLLEQADFDLQHVYRALEVIAKETDFNLARFVVCTDAGLSSITNRKFNDKQGRAFITIQSIKKLKKHLKEWALDPNG